MRIMVSRTWRSNLKVNLVNPARKLLSMMRKKTGYLNALILEDSEFGPSKARERIRLKASIFWFSKVS
jgi:hypothetical protein|tara:strand:+ start:2910 stop:3113 length:204 start_codon:yes stop_codon:yes gene_type:complete